MGAFDVLIARSLPWIPRPLVWRVARRYIAGLDLEDAARVIDGLKRRGLRATVDVLGENVTGRGETLKARDAYCAALERLHAGDLPAGISIKLTQLGLKIDPTLARENLASILDRAAELSRFVRIDMEDSSTTDATIQIYREFRESHSNVGMVLQAYLRRTLEDARALLPLNPDIRLCKGIYREPPDLAFQEYDEVRQSFLRILHLLLANDARVAIATHDSHLIREGIRLSEVCDKGSQRHEFQMLLGVGERRWDALIAANHKLRIYVPFGRHWYPYSLRRLRENPSIAGHVFRNLFRFDRQIRA